MQECLDIHVDVEHTQTHYSLFEDELSKPSSNPHSDTFIQMKMSHQGVLS